MFQALCKSNKKAWFGQKLAQNGNIFISSKTVLNGATCVFQVLLKRIRRPRQTQGGARQGIKTTSKNMSFGQDWPKLVLLPTQVRTVLLRTAFVFQVTSKNHWTGAQTHRTFADSICMCNHSATDRDRTKNRTKNRTAGEPTRSVGSLPLSGWKSPLLLGLSYGSIVFHIVPVGSNIQFGQLKDSPIGQLHDLIQFFKTPHGLSQKW